MKRFVPSLIGLALLVALVATAASPAAASGPNFDKDNFHHPTRIANKFMPLDPGTTFVYQGTKDGAPASDNVIVTHQTKKIIGVTTVVVRDQAFDENGKLVEDTFDWYAQDDAGNVWYFGEDTKELDPDTGQVISTEGSWQAGTRGARPGIIMDLSAGVCRAGGRGHGPGPQSACLRLRPLRLLPWQPPQDQGVVAARAGRGREQVLCPGGG
jgi:hypothetical protein